MVGRQPRRKVKPLLGTGALARLLVLGLAGWLGARPALAAQQSGQSGQGSSQPNSTQGSAQQGQQGQQAKSSADKPQPDKTAPAKPQPSAPRRVYSNGTGTYYEAPATESRPAASGSTDSATSGPSNASGSDERRMQRIWLGSPASPAGTAAGKAGATPDKTAKPAQAAQAAGSQSSPQAGPPSGPQSGPPSGPQSGTRTYSYSDGVSTYYQTVETVRKPTRDGEVVTRQTRLSNAPGAQAEQEVRTRNLPDGTVETETITKSDDGSGHQIPVGMVRERLKKSGDKTTIEREILNADGEGRWNTSQKEQVNESGTEQDRKVVKQILQPDISGSWKVVDRSETLTKAGKDGQEESHTVRQVPDAYGRMRDYEIQEEHTTKQGGKETHEVSLKRRDSQDTDHPNFFLVDKTLETRTASADGKTVTTHSTTQSDLLPDGSYRDVESYQPRVVQETTEVTTKGPDGEKTVKEVKQRDVANPNDLKPAYKVVQQADKNGNVRQVYIPSQR